MSTQSMATGRKSKLRDGAVEAWRRLVAWWRSLSSSDAWLVGVVACVVCAGVVLRVLNLGFPPNMTFDEDHFVLNARNYLVGTPDRNDHPPLGKLLLALGIMMLEDGSVGWRILPLVFGLQSIVVSYYLAKHLFQDLRAGLIAAAFIAGDGFFLCYSRTALLDGILACLVLWSALALVVARSWKGIVAAAVLIGCASSIKWSGGTMVIPFVVSILAKERRKWTWLLALLVVPVIHVGLWSWALWLTGQPASPWEAWSVMTKLYEGHQARAAMVHRSMSKWFTWPLLWHPITLRNEHSGLRLRVLSTIGNPLLWWSSTLLLVGTVGGGLWQGVRRVVARLRKKALVPNYQGFPWAAGLLLVVCWASPILPWLFTRRDTYIYHYLPAYGFALVLLAGGVAWAYRRWRSAAVTFLAAALLVAAWYSPVATQRPVSHSQMERLLYFESWK